MVSGALSVAFEVSEAPGIALEVGYKSVPESSKPIQGYKEFPARVLGAATSLNPYDRRDVKLKFKRGVSTGFREVKEFAAHATARTWAGSRDA